MNGDCEWKTMDEITNEKIVKEKDKKISFGLYDLDESSAPWLILSGNNNNNDDANLNATLSTQNMEKDEKCCNFDYFPMQKKKNLRDQAQQHGKSDDKLNIEKQADGDSIKQEENVDANDKGNDLKTKDSDAGTDDDNNNDNSFENLSYISGDEQLGVIDDIILLPNNLYSEDEMSNSDDCIYAYRGVDFEPIRSSPEDENDFLEMDFEPDPSSEIEQDNRSLRQLDGSENGVARDSNLPNRIHADLASFDVEIKPNITCNRSDIPPPSKSDKVVESGENTANGVEASAFKSLGADTHTESCDCSTSLNSDSHSSADDPLEKNDIIANTDANLRHESCSSNAPMASQSSQQSSTAIASASFTTKKYTGTIPKTNRNYLNLRSGRPKVLNASFGSTKTHRVNYPSYMCKRWKNANSVPDTLTYQTNDESQNAKDTMQTFQDSAKTKSNTKRSMSFPFEGFVHSEEESNNETQVVPTSSQVTAKLHSSQSQNQLFKQDEHVANGITFNGNCHGSVHNNASVTIFTGNCNIDVISAALVRIHFFLSSKTQFAKDLIRKYLYLFTGRAQYSGKFEEVDSKPSTYQ